MIGSLESIELNSSIFGLPIISNSESPINMNYFDSNFFSDQNGNEFLFSDKLDHDDKNESSFNIIISTNYSDNNANRSNEPHLNQKRGRKPNKKKRKKHDKFSRDNIKRKLQVHYIEFLRNLINQLIKEILKTEKFQFLQISYEFASNISKKAVDSLKIKTIGEILRDNISPKYTFFKNNNICVYHEICEKSNIIKNILNKKYLSLFNVYINKINKLDKSKYGLDQDFYLSNVENLKDLLKKNETNIKSDNIKFKEMVQKVINLDFREAPTPIFYVIKKI